MAGVGNVLRSDDAFGVRVAERLVGRDLGPDVRVIETGIGGIHLVQELMDPVDVLLVLDATDRGRPPGTVMVIEPEVADVTEMPLIERYDYLCDMHYANPERAFVLARGLGVLPPTFLLIGCQPVDAETPAIGMSVQVTAAVDVAVGEVVRIITELRDAAV
ncbi:hydrogenase maturation protease [soil metagenome]